MRNTIAGIKADATNLSQGAMSVARNAFNAPRAFLERFTRLSDTQVDARRLRRYMIQWQIVSLERAGYEVSYVVSPRSPGCNWAFAGPERKILLITAKNEDELIAALSRAIDEI